MEEQNKDTGVSTGNSSPHYIATSESQIVEKETIDYIAGCKDLMNERDCTSELLSNINNEIELHNSIRQKKDKFKKLKDLIPYSIAKLIASRGDVALIGEGDSSQTGKLKQYSIKEKNKLPIGYYQTDGFNKGVWETDNTPDNNFSVLAEKYKPTITQKEKKEAFGYLKNMLTVIPKCVVPYYVAVDNGIYDVVNKKLFDFSPDIVFTCKIHTTLNFQATNPHIPIPEENNTFWDVDDWLNSLGTPSFVESIKEVIQAACMPLVPRNKMVLFFSISGNSGKGTICELIRNLLGKEVVTSIPIKNFSTPFGLSNLPDSLAVVTDENNVNEYIKELGVIKSVITGDVVTINQKYEKQYDFQYKGLVLQCVNELPNVADKSGSFKRRLHIIPFSKCFTGVERKFIKERLIYREDVLEYILKMVLVDMPYRTCFTETKETRDALAEYESFTNSVFSFLDEVLPMARWNLLPAGALLYEAYKKWYCEVSPSGKILGRNEFISSVKEYAASRIKTNPNFDWEWTNSTRSDNYINLNFSEPIAKEFEVEPFLRAGGYGNYYRSLLRGKYSGLKRRSFAMANPDMDDDLKGENENESSN